MVSSTLIEIIFNGTLTKLKLGFLSKLLPHAKEVRFNYPEDLSMRTPEQVLETFYSNDYIDLVVSTDFLEVNGRIVKDAFVNVGRDDDRVEVLFYFDVRDLNDLKDVNSYVYKESINRLKIWAEFFKVEYNFDYFIGQMDNADKDEYYFDSNGFGPLYKLISR